MRDHEVTTRLPGRFDVAPLDEADPLAAVDILAGLEAGERQQLLARCRLRTFPAGAAVIDEESEGREVVFILEGRVRVVDRTASGRVVTFDEIEAGGHVGELAAIDGGPRTALVEAASECRVALLHPDRFIDLLLLHPPVGLALLQRLVRIIRDADRRISELSTIGAAGRLCRELLRRSQPGGDAAGSTRIVDPLPTQEQLASLTGATRETVARLLGQLQQAGLVRRRGQCLVVIDVARTTELAGLHEI